MTLTKLIIATICMMIFGGVMFGIAGALRPKKKDKKD